MDNLPIPDKVAAASSATLASLIQQKINQQGGWLSFADYMQMALYTPAYGYYTGGAQKFGQDGDFITAPILTPLFGHTLAQQLNALLPQTAGNIYEFGAGTGQLATSVLTALDSGQLKHYYIIELSAELAERQRTYIRTHIPDLADKVVHLSCLPAQFDGILLGNEVLDAMPVPIYQYVGNQIEEMGVSWQDNHLCWSPQPVKNQQIKQQVMETFPVTSEMYQSELHPQQHAFVTTLAQKLHRGAMIWIDYGFDAAQYYHPQRRQGTLIGHYRHHTIHDPFYYPGLTDLTAHVNFTCIADAGVENKLDLIGYTTQATFLLNLGITELLAQTGLPDETAYIKAAAACHTLLDTQEMGELFKVIAFGKNIDVDWLGFRYGDLCHKL
ncbi:class I SAM-dependent methyltransferase [Snodgrassella alvi]|uniref:class I SAM-dependent methyltransferase n=1 Tax=Snodgrassella alvi TaxID=1196083 RepID=UPI0035111D5F